MIRFPGLTVGHATDPALKSGVTVFLPTAPAIAACHVSGGGPATRETDLLKPGNLVERVDAVVLSGGSAFGLAAADGVMSWLSVRGRGFQVRDRAVPIVSAASLFDLANGGRKPEAAQFGHTYAALGRAACDAAQEDTAVGSLGAGTGATSADLKGGFGAALSYLADGLVLAAYVAANPVGRVTIGSSPHFRAAIFEQDSEFGGLGLPTPLPPDAGEVVLKPRLEPGASTMLATIVTNADLTRADLGRLAVSAHDGMAIAAFPAHTIYDGDIVFAMTTGEEPVPDRAKAMLMLGAAAATTLARAIAVAVFSAEHSPDDQTPSWRSRYGF